MKKIWNENILRTPCSFCQILVPFLLCSYYELKTKYYIYLQNTKKMAVALDLLKEDLTITCLKKMQIQKGKQRSLTLVILKVKMLLQKYGVEVGD